MISGIDKDTVKIASELQVGRELFASPSLQQSSFIMVSSSLPALDMIDSSTPLLTKITLHERLKLLAEQDRRDIMGILKLTLAIQHKVTIDRHRLTCWWRDLQKRKDCPEFQQFIDRYFYLRTVLTAMRFRSAGYNASQAFDLKHRWALHPCAEELCKHWDVSDFGVSGEVPELNDMPTELMHSPERFTRNFYEQLWVSAGKRQQNHWFDFSSIAFYVFRWQLAVDYRAFNVDAASERLNTAVGEIVSGADELMNKQINKKIIKS
ncbi:MAG: hypothetical protein V7699_00780 [Porticoccus sp.]